MVEERVQRRLTVILTVGCTRIVDEPVTGTLIAAAFASASAQQFTMKIGHPLPPKTTLHVWADAAPFPDTLVNGFAFDQRQPTRLSHNADRRPVRHCHVRRCAQRQGVVDERAGARRRRPGQRVDERRTSKVNRYSTRRRIAISVVMG